MSVSKPWRNKEWLYDQYVTKRRTLAQIVDECKSFGIPVTEMTIYNNLKAFNIPIRGGSRNLGKRSVGGNAAKRKRGGFY